MENSSEDYSELSNYQDNVWRGERDQYILLQDIRHPFGYCKAGTISVFENGYYVFPYEGKSRAADGWVGSGFMVFPSSPISELGNPEWYRKVSSEPFVSTPQTSEVVTTESKKSSFLSVLEENYQAQIARYYNDGFKTEGERKLINAIIEEYKDLIAIFKSNKYL
jgi:hypothetical protein